MQEREIRAIFDDTTVRVYQAYRPEIAKAALRAGKFVPPFSMSRMTWIKPSFCWMMYRSGCASKPGQEVVLGIDITREGFEWALEHSILSMFRPDVHSSHAEWKRLVAGSPVRIQWDPERNLELGKIEAVRTIQIGLSGAAVERYVNRWTVRIEDITPTAVAVHKFVRSGGALGILPPSEFERPYPINSKIAATILASAAD